MLQRTKYLQKLQKLCNESKVVTLLGARQVGKTTLMKQFQKTCSLPSVYINCENFFETPFSSLNAMIQWMQNEYGLNLHQPGFLFLDEIQARHDPDRIIKSYYDDEDIKTTLIVT